MNTLLVLLATILIFFYVWLKRCANYWKDRGFASVEFSFPFGSMKGVGSEIAMTDALDGFYKQSKGRACAAIGFYQFLKPLLLITDPQLLKEIMVTNFDSFHNRYMFHNQEDDPISAHLLALEGKAWKDRRVSLTPTFTSSKMKLMFDIVEQLGEKLVNVVEKESLNASGNVEVSDFLARFTTDSISSVAFGVEGGCLEDPNSPLRKYGKDILDFKTFDFLKFFFTSCYPELSRRLHMRCNKGSIIDFFHNTFVENMKYREEHNIVRNDFLQILIELRKTSSLTHSELAAESFLFFVAGFETSSSVSLFTIYELAFNSEIQLRLRKEIKSGIEKNNGKLTYELLSEFKYLDMVVNEGLRKYPPAFIMRKCTKEFQIPGSGLIIPEGTQININVFSFHRDPQYFPEPDKFDPERFNPENIRKILPFTFLPFGHGPRKCIGGRFGLMQSKMSIAKMVANFEISPNDSTIKPMTYSPPSLFLTPERAVYLTLKKI